MKKRLLTLMPGASLFVEKKTPTRRGGQKGEAYPNEGLGFTVSW